MTLTCAPKGVRPRTPKRWRAWCTGRCGEASCLGSGGLWRTSRLRSGISWRGPVSTRDFVPGAEEESTSCEAASEPAAARTASSRSARSASRAPSERVCRGRLRSPRPPKLWARGPNAAFVGLREGVECSRGESSWGPLSARLASAFTGDLVGASPRGLPRGSRAGASSRRSPCSPRSGFRRRP